MVIQFSKMKIFKQYFFVMVSIRKILKGVQGPGIKFAYKTKHMLREILGNLKTKTETSEMVGINEISYDCNEKFCGQN